MEAAIKEANIHCSYAVPELVTASYDAVDATDTVYDSVIAVWENVKSHQHVIETRWKLALRY